MSDQKLLTEVLLCVGGTHDGRRYTSYTPAEYVHLADPPEPAALESYHNEVAPTFTRSVYQRQPWKGKDRVRYVLVPLGQSPDTTLALLLDGYRNGQA